MKREFLRDGVTYAGTSLAVGAANVALVLVYTRGLEPSAYGVVEFVAVVQLLIQVVGGLELTQAITRFSGGADTEIERRAYASTGLWFLAAAYLTACALLFVAATPVATMLLAGNADASIVRASAVALFFGMLFAAALGQLRTELRAGAYALASIVAFGATLVLSLYLVLALRVGLIGVFVASGTGSLIGLAVCLYQLRRTYAWTFDMGTLRRLLAFSLPLVTSSLAVLGALYGDRLVIRAALGFDDLGIYAAAAKMAAIVAVASAGFELAVTPLVYRHHGREETPATLAQLLRLFLFGGLVGTLGLGCVSLEILTLLTTPSYVAAWRVVPVLALATVLTKGYVFLPGLTLRNMTTRFAAINIAAATTTLALVALLVTPYGIFGAALGTLGGAGVALALHATASQRTYRLPVEWPRIGWAVSVTALTLPLIWLLGQPDLPSLLERIGVLVAACGVLSLLMLTPSDRSVILRILSSPIAAFRVEPRP